MTVESGYAEINGARIYYEVAGDGPPLVFLHCFTLDRRMWDEQFALFAAGHRVVRYDLRGFGSSDLPTSAPFSNHDDLRLLLDHLGIERAHLCGLSSGGGLAIDVALEYPERVLSLVLIASALGGSRGGLGSMTATMVAMQAAAGRGDLDEAKRIWVGSPLFAPASRDPELARRLSEIVDDWSGWQLTHQPNHLDPDPPAAQRIGRLVAPALVLIGELDNEVVQSTAAEIETNAPNARRVVVRDAGHLANLEAPEVVNDLIAAFLAEG